MADTLQSRIGAEAFEKYKNTIGRLESQNKYIPDLGKGAIPGLNEIGFAGKYQIGVQGLHGTGELNGTADAINAQLRSRGQTATILDDANWKQPGGVRAFLNSPERQEKAFVSYTDANYRALLKNKSITPDMPPDEVAARMGASHLLGARGFKEKGLEGTDANGTRAATFYNAVKKDQNGTAPYTPPTAQNGKASDDKTPTDSAVKTGSNRQLIPTKIGNEVTIGGTTKKKPPIPLPFSNVLSEFSSYNSVITISCINKDMHSDPKRSYKNGNIGTVVLRSSGAGDLAGESAIKSKENPAGKYDFGINNIEIRTQITFNSEYQASNGYNISFDVYEPYSMGLFLQVCQNAAESQGWSSYLNPAIFLLTFEFVGHDADGKSIKIPNTNRHVPFTFTTISMSTTAGGSVYRITALPSNAMVFLNNFKLFEHDISIEGSTVQEALQTGERSLQTIVNKRLQEYASTATVPTAFDEVVIIFPKINQLTGVNQKGQSIGEEIRTEDGSVSNFRRNTETGELYDATGLPLQQSGVAKADPRLPPPKTTLSRKISAANLIQDSDDLNLIGKSILEFDPSMAGDSKSNDQNDVQVDPANPISRKRVTYDKNVRQFTYSQGTSIVNAISSILLHSKYCRAGLDAQKVDPKGMIPWFRIESEVHFQEPKEGNIGDNNQPKLLVFKVVPYLVHSEKNAANQAAPAGLAELATEVAKVYDYLYTGQNTEVLGFNIEFQQAMFNSVMKGVGLDDASLTANGRNSATPESNTAKITNDNSSYWGERNSGRMKSNPPPPEGPSNPGGSTATDNKTRVAEAFQRALNDSDTDLVNIPNFTIMGDPYFLADSGLGNFSNTGSGSFNVTDSLTMDYQSGEVDIAITFRTPVDYNSSTGLMDFGDTSIVKHFSGLYKVNEATHKFNNGKFTTELSLQRRRNQTAESTNKPFIPFVRGGQVPAAQSLSPGEFIVDNTAGVAFSGAAQNAANDRSPEIEGPVSRAPSSTAFNRSDLAKDSGESGSATANPTAAGSFAKSFVEGLGIIRNKIVSTLTKPKSTNETDNTSELNK
jgi:hypothetical protein